MRKLFFGIFLFIFICEVKTLFAEVATPAEPAVNVEKSNSTSKASIGFNTYEQSLDDLLRIKVLTHPDPEFGINGMIVELNRKLAENPEDVSALVSLGHVYRILSQPQEADRFYEKALMLSPDRFHLNVFSAQMNFQQARFEKSLKTLNDALDSNPYDPDVWAAHAKTQLQLQNREGAVMSYEKVLSLDPGNEEALFILSQMHQEEGKYFSAQKYLDMLANKHPEDQNVQYHRGALLFAQKKLPEAIEAWEKLFYGGVRSPKFLFNLTLAYIDYGDNVKAERILKHMRFFFPREPDIDFLFAETYRQMKRLDEAESKYLEVISLNPMHVSSYIGLAQLYESKGESEKARQVLQQGSAVMQQRQKTLAQSAANSQPFPAEA